jgi:hypothetical protein
MQEDISLARAQRELQKRRDSELRVANITNQIRRTRKRREQEAKDTEDVDEEKALSDCDDEEWARRYPTVIEEVKNPKPFIPGRTGEFQKWDSGSRAMFAVRDTEQKDAVAGNKSSPCMSPISCNPAFHNTTNCLPPIGARPLTKIDVIVAVSTSLDWFEKHPSIPTPTPAEMTKMLNRFARSKRAQAQQSQAPNPNRHQIPQVPSANTSLTPERQVAGDGLLEASSPSASENEQTTVNDEEEPETGHDEDLNANVEDNRVEPADPFTPPPQRESETARTWAAALSASVIGSVLRNPVNWFTRRNRTPLKVPATEPRPVKAKIDSTRSAKTLKKALHRDTPSDGSAPVPAKSSPSRSHGADLPPTSPTPAPRPRHRGRPDSHLPVHLRGVRYEDLPPEWQTVSQHMKKEEPAHEEEPLPAEDEDEKVVLAKLLKIAYKTRAERAMKQKVERVRERERKKSVTFTDSSVKPGRLGHSTYGMESDSDDSSSSESENDMEPHSPIGRTLYFDRQSVRERREARERSEAREQKREARERKRETRERRREAREGGPVHDRNATPKKSCLKRPFQQPTSDSSDGSDVENVNRSELRPAKKPRLGEPVHSPGIEAMINRVEKSPSSTPDAYLDLKHRARPPSNFISIPPSRLAEIEEERRRWDEIHPVADNPKNQAELDEMMRFWGNKFHEEAMAKELPPVKEKLPFWVSAKGWHPAEEDNRRSQADYSDEALKEVSNERLNKAREQALKYKPKKPSSLQQTQIMSPVHDRIFPRVISDIEAAAVAAWLDEDEIEPEPFGKPPFMNEGTISREATKVVKPNFARPR